MSIRERLSGNEATAIAMKQWGSLSVCCSIALLQLNFFSLHKPYNICRAILRCP